jgi:hypothetical protein
MVIIMFARALKQWTTIKCCQNGPSLAKNCTLQFALDVYRLFRCLTEDGDPTSRLVPFQVLFGGFMREHHNEASSPLALDGRTGLRRGIRATRHPPN